jgi:superfamily I DNA/RNA helicase
MAIPTDVVSELESVIEAILASTSPKKLVVAGPGAGKTTLFRKLIDAAEGEPRQRLVLTFINNLKGDLDRKLGDVSRVFTLHGYCQYLLRRNKILRNGLSETFRCHPGLRDLIPKDWDFLRGGKTPQFVRLMRELSCPSEQAAFYLERTNYYDAVDFDDSVYRTYLQLAAAKESVPEYTLVLIDEFQDFNKMEASIIDLLAESNSIVIAGDDDQALYSQLRSASWEHIRAHYVSGHYEIFELPFCMRCPEVIVGAVNDIIAKAHERKRLNGRIPKPYRYFEPVKAEDSAKYPHIELIETTVQRANANYFGRYIEQSIKNIPEDEVALAAEQNEPVALIIGSDPYRRQVEEYLTEVGLVTAKIDAELTQREKALQILSDDEQSNLGWRIILACGKEEEARKFIRQADENNQLLAEVILPAQREQILAEAKAWAAQNEAVDPAEEADESGQKIAITSYEGSKGRSAQYVFLIGVHSGELPKNAAAIDDIEICRFLVGLTRTRKRCSILVANNAMGRFKNRSEFIAWINSARLREKKISAAYWT